MVITTQTGRTYRIEKSGYTGVGIYLLRAWQYHNGIRTSEHLVIDIVDKANERRRILGKAQVIQREGKK
ncbi:hypothetical protein AB3K25_04310 [Leuconostoc sp. MS02]|uniref:Uncharacterized protein n=1 Tax=Leuconostoc aquikimchii TaxID=3236804 RepID=A0ABV3S354_9LACO